MDFIAKFGAATDGRAAGLLDTVAVESLTYIYMRVSDRGD
jgi:hypothetical protein